MGEVIKEKEVWVHSYRMPPDSNTSIKMEVGIEDCLHIEFEYNKAKSVQLTWLATLGTKLTTQVSPQRRHCGQDLLPPRPYKDQAYGAIHHPTRNYRLGTKSIQ
jgi:hypothetical protein